MYAGVATGAGAPYFTMAVLATSAELLWQMVTLDFDDGVQCWSVFKVRTSFSAALIRRSSYVLAMN